MEVEDLYLGQQPHKKPKLLELLPLWKLLHNTKLKCNVSSLVHAYGKHYCTNLINHNMTVVNHGNRRIRRGVVLFEQEDELVIPYVEVKEEDEDVKQLGVQYEADRIAWMKDHLATPILEVQLRDEYSVLHFFQNQLVRQLAVGQCLMLHSTIFELPLQVSQRVFDVDGFIINNVETDVLFIRRKAEDEFLVTISDIKLPQHPKPQHWLQVALYYRTLTLLFEVWELEGRISYHVKVDPYVTLMLRNRSTPASMYALSPQCQSALDEMQQMLKQVVVHRQNRTRQIYVMKPSCQSCDHYKGCYRLSRTHMDFRLIPNISVDGLKYLTALCANGQDDLPTLLHHLEAFSDRQHVGARIGNASGNGNMSGNVHTDGSIRSISSSSSSGMGLSKEQVQMVYHHIGYNDHRMVYNQLLSTKDHTPVPSYRFTSQLPSSSLYSKVIVQCRTKDIISLTYITPMQQTSSCVHQVVEGQNNVIEFLYTKLKAEPEQKFRSVRWFVYSYEQMKNLAAILVEGVQLQSAMNQQIADKAAYVGWTLFGYTLNDWVHGSVTTGPIGSYLNQAVDNQSTPAKAQLLVVEQLLKQLFMLPDNMQRKMEQMAQLFGVTARGLSPVDTDGNPDCPYYVNALLCDSMLRAIPSKLGSLPVIDSMSHLLLRGSKNKGIDCIAPGKRDMIRYTDWRLCVLHHIGMQEALKEQSEADAELCEIFTTNKSPVFKIVSCDGRENLVVECVHSVPFKAGERYHILCLGASSDPMDNSEVIEKYLASNRNSTHHQLFTVSNSQGRYTLHNRRGTLDSMMQAVRLAPHAFYMAIRHVQCWKLETLVKRCKALNAAPGEHTRPLAWLNNQCYGPLGPMGPMAPIGHSVFSAGAKSVYRVLTGLGLLTNDTNSDAGVQTFDYIVGMKTSLVLGPPGVGKSYQAVRILASFLLHGIRTRQQVRLVFMTVKNNNMVEFLHNIQKLLHEQGVAYTHHHLVRLVDKHDGQSSGWKQVVASYKSNRDINDFYEQSKQTLLVTTVWQLAKDRSNRINGKHDLVICDEASLMSLYEPMILMDDLDYTRLCFIGDDQQITCLTNDLGPAVAADDGNQRTMDIATIYQSAFGYTQQAIHPHTLNHSYRLSPHRVACVALAYPDLQSIRPHMLCQVPQQEQQCDPDNLAYHGALKACTSPEVPTAIIRFSKQASLVDVHKHLLIPIRHSILMDRVSNPQCPILFLTRKHNRIRELSSAFAMCDPVLDNNNSTMNASLHRPVSNREDTVSFTTIDSSQGRECDIVVLDMMESVIDYQRLIVAITRPHTKLIILSTTDPLLHLQMESDPCMESVVKLLGHIASVQGTETVHYRST